MGKIFYLKKTSKGDFAKWLEHYRERNQRIGTGNGYYELYRVRHTSKGRSLDSVYVGFYGEGTVETVELPGLITFELIQISEDLKVIAECKDDYGLIAPITAYFLKLLHVLREEYGDAYEEPEARVDSAVKQQEPVAPQPPTSAGANARDILPTELEVGGKYGTCRDLTIRDVRAIVAKCLAFTERGGKVTAFYEQLNITPGQPRSFELETLRGWLKDPKFRQRTPRN